MTKIIENKKNKSKYSLWEKYEQEFCFRRAWRYGSLTVQDMQEAFGMTKRSISRRFSEVVFGALNEHSLTNINLRKIDENGTPYLLRFGNHIIPNKKANIPKCADESDFIRKTNIYNTKNTPYGTSSQKEIDDEMAQLFFVMTGLRAEEINLDYHHIINNHAPQNGTLLKIISSIISNPKTFIQATYVSLNNSDEGKQIRFIPLSLQIIGEQLSVYAYKHQEFKNGEWISSEGQRIYVLSRIYNCSVPMDLSIKQRNKLLLPISKEELSEQVFYLNEKYTKQQKDVISLELNLNQGSVTLPKSCMFQFLRLYSNLPANGIWPPLILPEHKNKKDET